MAERDIVAAILRLLKKTPDCFAWKEHGGMYGTAGIPDIIACIGGRFVAFEVKTPTGKLTKLQEITIQKIRMQKDKPSRSLRRRRSPTYSGNWRSRLMNDNPMTAKEYLSQAYRIDQRINAKLEQAERLRELSRRRTVAYGGERVSHSRNVHHMEDTVVRLIEAERALDREIDAFLESSRKSTRPSRWSRTRIAACCWNCAI